jgi:rRNA biogenesis protein RRP5
MKILAQVVSIEPLALVVSLPNQLYGHLPITQISSELTASLESMDVDEESSSNEEEEEEQEEDAEGKATRLPDLFDLFRPGQYLRCIVVASHAAGTTKAGTRKGRAATEIEKASERVELSLIPEQVNQGVLKTDLKPGFVSDSEPIYVYLTHADVDYVRLCQKY